MVSTLSDGQSRRVRWTESSYTHLIPLMNLAVG
uniref:Uncharacterized protein n=1 Tax=Triticum urartu TaxID=4572 RepID=A0A8R7TME7_TRIUA